VSCLCFYCFVYFSWSTSRRVTTESAGPIFTKFSELIDVRMASLTVHLFCDRRRDVAMPTIFLAKLAKLADPTFIQHTGVLKSSAGSQSRFRRLNVNYIYILRSNLVTFGAVTPEFTTLDCVQQASIITDVCLSTFTRGWYC